MSFIGRKPRCRDLFLCENARKKYQDYIFTKVKNKTNLFFIFMYVIQHCFICRPSDSNAGIEYGLRLGLRYFSMVKPLRSRILN
jgi:hypothetical protein